MCLSSRGHPLGPPDTLRPILCHSLSRIAWNPRLDSLCRASDYDCPVTDDTHQGTSSGLCCSAFFMFPVSVHFNNAAMCNCLPLAAGQRTLLLRMYAAIISYARLRQAETKSAALTRHELSQDFRTACKDLWICHRRPNVNGATDGPCKVDTDKQNERHRVGAPGQPTRSECHSGIAGLHAALTE